MALGTIDLTSGTKLWANVELQQLTARGRLTPRLGLNFKASTPTERIQTELHHVRVQLHHDNELLGEGLFLGELLSSFGNSVFMEIPISHQILDYVTNQLGPQADVNLKMFCTGIIRVKWSPSENDPRVQGDPDPDVWTQMTLSPSDRPCTIPRSDWYSKVLQPTGQGQYVYQEIAVLITGEWTQVLSHLTDAEKAYATGDDAGVFAKLRGAVEALPGYPKDIVTSIPEPQRKEVNALLKAVGDFLHSGRHVSQTGESAGSFPVDRRAAYFALSTMKVMLSYLSQILTQNNPTP